jgi:hypothetical protein
MTHEAARPFALVKDARPPGACEPAINDVLAALKPRLRLCGHHYRFVETVREGVTSVCLDRINRSYLLIDASTLDHRRVDQR